MYQENHHVLVLQVFRMARLVRATGINTWWYSPKFSPKNDFCRFRLAM